MKPGNVTAVRGNAGCSRNGWFIVRLTGRTAGANGVANAVRQKKGEPDGDLFSIVTVRVIACGGRDGTSGQDFLD
jgi:hypothetical protein